MKRIFLMLALVSLFAMSCGDEFDGNSQNYETIDIQTHNVVDPLAGMSQVSGISRYNSTDKSCVVNQWSVSSTDLGSSGKPWVCAHASLATSLNLLRGNYVSNSTKKSQLIYIDSWLEGKYGSDYTSDPHRQASIDQLQKFMGTKTSEFYSEKKYSSSRSTIKSLMINSLRNDYLVLALAQTVTNSNTFGHFYVVYAINYQPTQYGGGTVYYADPNTGGFGTMYFSTFLDRMKSAGNPNHHSFLKMKRY